MDPLQQLIAEVDAYCTKLEYGYPQKWQLETARALREILRPYQKNLTTRFSTLVFALLLGTTLGCTDTSTARIDAVHTALHTPATITVYSGGQPVATFQSHTGVDCTSAGTCSFLDAATGQLVQTTGTLIVRSDRRLQK